MDGIYESFYHYGMKKFLHKKKHKNLINGTIIPDLPFEMAQTYSDLFKKYNKSNISFLHQLIVKKNQRNSYRFTKKFIYMVAYAGITGSGQRGFIKPLLKM